MKHFKKWGKKRNLFNYQLFNYKYWPESSNEKKKN